MIGTMGGSLFPNLALHELAAGQEGDFFALLSAKEELTTREGKPYFKVTFRDAGREVSTPLWHDSAWAAECKASWEVGAFYKLRAVYFETIFGPQLEIKKIRPAKMFDELVAMAKERIADEALRGLVVDILLANREGLLTLPAATRNHHAYVAGWLEHTLSVTRTAVFLADKYDDYYPTMQPRLDKGVAIAGAILHDIGKLREYEQQPAGTVYSAEGNLIGHMLQGRDIVRETAAGRKISPETLLRLEHVVIAHQGKPEWGSPKVPMTPEALIVHYADDLDAKYNMVFQTLRDDKTMGPMTSKKNQLYQQVFRGLQ
jgi:3'-5' exoribonuclease